MFLFAVKAVALSLLWMRYIWVTSLLQGATQWGTDWPWPSAKRLQWGGWEPRRPCTPWRELSMYETRPADSRMSEGTRKLEEQPISGRWRTQFVGVGLEMMQWTWRVFVRRMVSMSFVVAHDVWDNNAPSVEMQHTIPHWDNEYLSRKTVSDGCCTFLTWGLSAAERLIRSYLIRSTAVRRVITNMK